MAAVISRKISQSNGPNTSSVYSFSSQPRAIFQRHRTSKSGSKSGSITSSLMNDKRLIKTGTIGTLVLHAQPHGGPSLRDILRRQEARRRDASLQSTPSAPQRLRTPPAAAGRQHCRVQTEPYLEELRDRRPETDRAVWTDPTLDRPVTPLFVPSKTGADVGTQICRRDLFDFELESAPILEVLVGKTVEQSLLEAMEEEELEALREHQRRFEERRRVELAEQQRLAERERRHVAERERRVAQRRAAVERETETEAKVAASALAQGYLTDMVPAVFSNLRRKGLFFDGIERDIETNFMPWLRGAVERELDAVLTGREVLDELVLDAVRRRGEERERRLGWRPADPAPPPPVQNETGVEEDKEEEEEEDDEDASEETVPEPDDEP